MSKLKYLKEVNEMLNYISEKQNISVESVLKERNLTINRLNEHIEVGVKNGYSAETQVKMVKLVMDMDSNNH